MCGIVGFYEKGSSGDKIISEMTKALTHRGPDHSEVYCDHEKGIFLGHTRLSVIDLSENGKQPMASPCERYILVFNGEIYNHLGVRNKLSARESNISWKGGSDTETIAKSLSILGVKQTLEQINGMFAICIYDKRNKELILARDRMGEKPIYYGWLGDIFVFSSELKALRKHPRFNAEINRNAITLYMRHNYIPTPYSIYEGISKLRPSSYITVSLQTRDVHEIQYWKLFDHISISPRYYKTEDERLVGELDELLQKVVSDQMISDVGVGSFLSGGIDSSLVSSIMQRNSLNPINTFTIGFNDKNYNEAEYAKDVATHIGSNHTELYVGERELIDVIPRLSTIYCEPFADSSQIPTFLVSQLARSKVTVSLSGDGGDELFGGYNRYTLAMNAWKKIRWLPYWSRFVISKGILAISPEVINRLYSQVSAPLPDRYKLSLAGDKAHKFARILLYNDPAEFYKHIVSQWKSPDSLVLGGTELDTALSDPYKLLDGNNFELWMMLVDMQSYLPDDILVKVDRAAMANSLETRAPLLDRRVVEFACGLPLGYKIRDGQGKWLLRKVLNRYVPDSLINRPKMGFGVPLDSWLRNELRDWGAALLSESLIKSQGYLNYAEISKKWNEHLRGKRNWGYHLWTVLMFQSWLTD